LVATDLSDTSQLAEAFRGFDAVAHCAGINREIGSQTYRCVHIQGTENVVAAARKAGVKKTVLISFLQARPHCGSPYHESKWAAEEIVRESGMDYTILKSGMVFGRGDHMLDHLSHSFFTIPFLPTVGLRQKLIRPVPIEDLVDILRAAIVDKRLSRQTIAITGAEELYLSEAARRVAAVLNRRIVLIPPPVWFHALLTRIFELTMKVPLVARAQVRILAEGVTEAAPTCDVPPPDLLPKRRFSPELIREGLPEPRPFSLRDLRCCTE